MKTHRGYLWMMLLMVVSLSPPAWGASCSINASGVAFGAYDPLSPTPKASNGSVTINCTYTTLGDLIGGFSTTLSLSQGSSGNYLNRTLKQGGQSLNYNLYLEPSFATVFGNGTAGTSTYSVCYPGYFSGCGGNSGQNGQDLPVPIYGRLTAGQDVGVGSYTDSIVATVTF